MKRFFSVIVTALVILIAMPTTYAKDVDESELAIVSLMPSNTEIVDVLGLTDSLIAITVNDNYPESLEDMELTTLDTFELDVETLIELEPTHILAHEMYFTALEDVLEDVIKATGAQVLNVRDAKTYEDIPLSIAEIGTFFGIEDEALDATETFEKELREVYEEISLEEPLDAIIMVSFDPDIYVVAADTFIHSLVSEMGINNIFDDIEGYQSVDYEDILERDPDILLSIAGLNEDDLSTTLDDSPLEVETACVINADLLSRPTPRVIEGLMEIHDCIKP